jgi:hypothetical protein
MFFCFDRRTGLVSIQYGNGRNVEGLSHTPIHGGIADGTIEEVLMREERILDLRVTGDVERAMAAIKKAKQRCPGPLNHLQLLTVLAGSDEDADLDAFTKCTHLYYIDVRMGVRVRTMVNFLQVLARNKRDAVCGPVRDIRMVLAPGSMLRLSDVEGWTNVSLEDEDKTKAEIRRDDKGLINVTLGGGDDSPRRRAFVKLFLETNGSTINTLAYTYSTGLQDVWRYCTNLITLHVSAHGRLTAPSAPAPESLKVVRVEHVGQSFAVGQSYAIGELAWRMRRGTVFVFSRSGGSTVKMTTHQLPTDYRWFFNDDAFHNCWVQHGDSTRVKLVDFVPNGRSLCVSIRKELDMPCARLVTPVRDGMVITAHKIAFE